MFQDFSSPPTDAGDPARIEKLRKALKASNVTGFLIPRADEHQGEYVPPHAERLAWSTGFTGSAGMAIVLETKAAIFIDGRYTLQVRDQVAVDVLTPINSADEPPAKWLEANLSAGDKLAYDPWLHTINEVKKLESAAVKASAKLIAHENLIDTIWDDQPSPPKAPVILQPLKFTGKPTLEKIKTAQDAIKDMAADAFLLTQPDSICWLLNIRGRDVPHTPLALCFALIHKDRPPELFIDAAKISQDVHDALAPHIALKSPEVLLPSLAAIKGTIALDPASTSHIFKTEIEAADNKIIEKADPCLLPKAKKNAEELEGSQQAHLRDGVAVTRFLSWLSRQPLENLSEISAAQKLESLRHEAGNQDSIPLQDISFDTISGVGPNGAIVHYRVTEATDKAFSKDTLYLVDSGGQYQDGTTDITRTIAIGTPSTEMKRHFTLVLKGMIAVSRLKFPIGTNGAQIDAFARTALWQEGLDFDHGTGHGVGSFLSVHEGPQRISKMSTIPLEPGMILSNEPGFYKAGAYGIRIENLIIVRAPEAVDGGERKMMSFETLTFAPIDRALIEPSLLTSDERDWLNEYHAEVREKLGPRLEGEDKGWLERATRGI
ncbi:MAG: aminopeptidase P family protein [Hyphomicrobiales bacterium]